jgi:hypothetical protein
LLTHLFKGVCTRLKIPNRKTVVAEEEAVVVPGAATALCLREKERKKTNSVKKAADRCACNPYKCNVAVSRTSEQHAMTIASLCVCGGEWQRMKSGGLHREMNTSGAAALQAARA